MNLSAKTHLEAAQKANGIRFDPILDWADLADIVALGDACMRAESEPPLIRPSVSIGSLTFYRLSYGALEWFNTVGEKLGSENLYAGALAYASHHAKTPAALWESPDERTAKKAVKDFMRGIGCTVEELFTELAAFLNEGRSKGLPGDKPSDPSKEPSGWGAALDILCNTYGRSPEDWLWRTTIDEFDVMLSRAITRMRMESGDKRADPNDRAVIASHRMVKQIRELVEKVKARA